MPARASASRSVPALIQPRIAVLQRLPRVQGCLQPGWGAAVAEIHEEAAAYPRVAVEACHRVLAAVVEVEALDHELGERGEKGES